MAHQDTCIYLGQELADYGFKDGHPFGPQRHDVFQAELIRLGLDRELSLQKPVAASTDRIQLFHTDDYIDKVRDYSRSGFGYLDVPRNEGVARFESNRPSCRGHF